MKTLTPLLFNFLPHADEVQAINDEDKACFKEIRDVLLKHGKLERFGLTLLHKHFDIQDDEVLIENTDEISRIQTITPMKIKDVEATGESLLETSWSLVDNEAVTRCQRKCVYQGGSHRPHIHVFMEQAAEVIG